MTGNIVGQEFFSVTPLASSLNGRAQCQSRRNLSFAWCVFAFACASLMAQRVSELPPAEMQLLDPDLNRLMANLREINGQTPPDQVAERVWKLVFTQATRPGSPSPSFFYMYRHVGMSGYVEWSLVELQGTFIPPQGEALSNADRANGIQYRGKAYFKESLLRLFEFNDGGTKNHGPWSKWYDAGAPEGWPTVSLEKTITSGWSVGFAFDSVSNVDFNINGGSSPYWAAQFKVAPQTALATDPFANLDGETHLCGANCPGYGYFGNAGWSIPNPQSLPRQAASPKAPAIVPSATNLFVCPGPPAPRFALQAVISLRAAEAAAA